MSMKVLDLFSGTGSATQAFLNNGHDVKHLDVIGTPELLIDIRKFAKSPEFYLGDWRPDVIWASPPCTAFSMAGSGSKKNGSRRWDYGKFPFYGPRLPRDETARQCCAFVLAALHTIDVLKPMWWRLENPMGGLSTMGFMRDQPGPVIVTYCQYGERRMKPTFLWGLWPTTWRPRPRCKNGDSCHEAAPRGAKTGTQGIAGARDRARVPYALSNDIKVACEIAFNQV